MSTPAKSIPEIPTATTVDLTDQFLVKAPAVTKPEKSSWNQMLTQALATLPSWYYNF